RVGHEDRGSAHRGEPANGLADTVIELRRGGVDVDVGEQVDEHLKRLDAGKQGGRRLGGGGGWLGSDRRVLHVRSLRARAHSGGGSRTGWCARPPAGRRGGQPPRYLAAPGGRRDSCRPFAISTPP